jgi:hypothetical protein
MTIKVPKAIKQEFLDFLDIAQFNLSTCSRLTGKEQKVLKFARKIVGNYSIPTTGQEDAKQADKEAR